MLFALRRKRTTPQAPAVPARPGLYLSRSWRAPTWPAEPVAVPWTPPYAELTVAQVTRRYGDSPADIAARWLREAGEQARAQLELAR